VQRFVRGWRCRSRIGKLRDKVRCSSKGGCSGRGGVQWMGVVLAALYSETVYNPM